MTPDEIITQAKSFGGWYHDMELTPGFWTGTYHHPTIREQWAMVRQIRGMIDYRGKQVLDVGTMDGMWAFEAERRGAAQVVAIDIWQGNYWKAKDRFLFARQVFGSHVVLEQQNVEELPLLDGDGLPHFYDVIQCPGVLYHLENPLRALRKMRSVIYTEGDLILETAVWPDYGPPMARFNSDRGIYDDPTTFWAFNYEALYDALRLTGWEPDGANSQSLKCGPTLRHCVRCKPI